MFSCNRADIDAAVVVAASVIVSLLRHAPKGQSLSWLWGRAGGRPEVPCSFTLNFLAKDCITWIVRESHLVELNFHEINSNNRYRTNPFLIRKGSGTDHGLHTLGK
jgi:hypothetical protein